MESSHDQFFQRTFSHAEHVEAFLRGILKPSELFHLDLNHLEKLAETQVSPKLQKHLADVVWRCPIRPAPPKLTAAKSPPANPEKVAKPPEFAYLCILLEHKSSHADFVHPQLLRYIAGLWEHQVSQGGKIHPVLPILFHQGDKPLDRVKLLTRFSHLPRWLRPLTPLFEYRLADLPLIDPDELERRFPGNEPRIELLAMKCVREGMPSRLLVGSFKELDPLRPLRELEALITYIKQKDDLEPEDLSEMAENRPEAEKEKIMTLEQKLIQIGKEEGLAEGEARGKAIGEASGAAKGLEEGLRLARLDDARKMKAKNYDLTDISEITGLSAAEIQAL